MEKADLKLRLSPAALMRLTTNTSGIEALKLQIVDGKLVAQATVRGMDASATVLPQARNGRIGLAVDKLAMEGIPEQLRDAVAAVLSRGITIPDLPFKASLQQITVEGQSVVLTATAANLQLAGA